MYTEHTHTHHVAVYGYAEQRSESGRAVYDTCKDHAPIVKVEWWRLIVISVV